MHGLITKFLKKIILRECNWSALSPGRIAKNVHMWYKLKQQLREPLRPPAIVEELSESLREKWERVTQIIMNTLDRSTTWKR